MTASRLPGPDGGGQGGTPTPRRAEPGRPCTSQPVVPPPAAQPGVSGAEVRLLVGIMSFFADFTCEGSRSIIGPDLGILGVGPLGISVITGIGEFLGSGLRVFSGRGADRRRAEKRQRREQTMTASAWDGTGTYQVSQVEALEILDSRGRPTRQVTVSLGNGAAAKAGVPSGASTGSREIERYAQISDRFPVWLIEDGLAEDDWGDAGGDRRVPPGRACAARFAPLRRDHRHVHRLPGRAQRVRRAETGTPARGERVAKYNRLAEISAAGPPWPTGSRLADHRADIRRPRRGDPSGALSQHPVRARRRRRPGQ